MTVNELKSRCEQLIEKDYGEANVIYFKDFFSYHHNLNLFTPDEYYDDTFFGKEFPNTSKNFVLIDEDD